VRRFKISNDPLFEEKVTDCRRALREPLAKERRALNALEAVNAGYQASKSEYLHIKKRALLNAKIVLPTSLIHRPSEFAS
jgi:hypothetical protein